MYVVVRRYTGSSALVDAMVQREREVRDLISSVPGVQGVYAARAGDGGAVTVTVCDSKAGTDESIRRAADGWARRLGRLNQPTGDHRGRDLHHLLTHHLKVSVRLSGTARAPRPSGRRHVWVATRHRPAPVRGP